MRRSTVDYVLESANTVDSDLQRRTNLTHTFIIEPPEALHKHSNRDTLDRVEIHC